MDLRPRLDDPLRFDGVRVTLSLEERHGESEPADRRGYEAGSNIVHYPVGVESAVHAVVLWVGETCGGAGRYCGVDGVGWVFDVYLE